ncbi:MAG: hypothetical protein K8R59_13335 [Thermoanaerobaculales bacterium]|nr:hypothetical protein [Thermoanaerobaculales bacterium]
MPIFGDSSQGFIGHAGLQMVDLGNRVETRGFDVIGRCDLMMRASTEAEKKKAKAVLFGLAAYLVSTAGRLEAGDEMIVGKERFVVSSFGSRFLEMSPVGSVDALAGGTPSVEASQLAFER